MNCAKYVAVDDKRAWYSGREGYPVRVTRRQGQTGVQVRSYRKAVWLRWVIVAD
jgi:hypothetical protein